jgi:hypothetical protein
MHQRLSLGAPGTGHAAQVNTAASKLPARSWAVVRVHSCQWCRHRRRGPQRLALAQQQLRDAAMHVHQCMGGDGGHPSHGRTALPEARLPECANACAGMHQCIGAQYTRQEEGAIAPQLRRVLGHPWPVLTCGRAHHAATEALCMHAPPPQIARLHAAHAHATHTAALPRRGG